MKTVNIELRAGDTQPIILGVVDDRGSAVDCTGATGKMTIGKVYQPSPGQVILSKDLEVLDGLAGKVQIWITPEDTDGKSGIFVYDIEIVYPDGFQETVVKGKVEILADVTP